ncbi:MAG: SUMF1/EgtB/PvdO family nonheme iron enzyme [Phycisphaerales bacterium]|nr:SUMF1/EgtB/PvdO family nonheme iron enzyme [Phycisphaerales bacterium]
MPNGSIFWPLSAAILLAGSSASLGAGGGLGRGDNSRGRPTDDFGIEFVRIGAPRNRAALPEERFYNQRFEDLGAVGYRYRMAKTEVTASQWVGFVNAYDPYWVAAGGSRLSSGFTGGWLSPSTLDPNQAATYAIATGAERLAVKVSWRVAATYCNWLHNGQVNEAWAFQSGAYDVSTFGGSTQDGYTDQPERSPGARFWIPNVDEWTKAAHYDPNRYGEGEEGYWLRMGSQNDPLTPGLPENGGQTNGGDFLPGFGEQFMHVGSYPHVGGPWGVLDTSGGVQEWTETVRSFHDDGVLHSGRRYVLGSQAGDSGYDDKDLIDWYFTAGGPSLERFGIRLASMIPSPGSAGIVLLFASASLARRGSWAKDCRRVAGV